MLVILLIIGGCDWSVGQPAESRLPSGKPEVQRLNQPPVPPVIRRKGREVFIEMTAQITQIEISKGVPYEAWTFGGTVPGPLIRVKEGDQLHFTLNNIDPETPHSMDFHAVHAAPNHKFTDVMPGDRMTFSYPANSPGVFMYHCGTKPVLMHLANGMYGMIIVEPKDGYPTDQQVDREYMIVQSEWYKENDYQDFLNGRPRYVVFNGDNFTLTDHPLTARTGDRVRLYVLNAGPNEVSSFHVVGTLMDTVYLDGNPLNVLHGMQTVLLPASGGAVVEFQLTEAGDYTMLSHQFNQASKGAAGLIRVIPDGK
ncbi:multicopper oxidase domain-containing protein [Paenibacillus sp. YPG26]|uniref:multicopper oxidase domain-containing protein n=1 Tax=Paenibacillus sp. YPG26 TaxID=2878915 RepID=UPI00203C7459|nr:multicopper oxidase domain-containing protein [Paenibacillus sp. YPG26]USB31728.1 multicopper oxidase domain-containing protein [Paenibacillus sp. YPG26]